MSKGTAVLPTPGGNPNVQRVVSLKYTRRLMDKPEEFSLKLSAIRRPTLFGMPLLLSAAMVACGTGTASSSGAATTASPTPVLSLSPSPSVHASSSSVAPPTTAAPVVIIVSGVTQTTIRSSSSAPCTLGPDAKGATLLTVDLSQIANGSNLTLVVPGYVGAGSYSAAISPFAAGKTAIAYNNPTLGEGRPQNEYDAVSGTVVVTSVAGHIVQGSIQATLTPFDSAPGQLTVSGSWSCTLS
jgi:S-formylglutathione hydrolase FrmB